MAAAYAPIARDLRNDAAHRIYKKTADGHVWRMHVSGHSGAILIHALVVGYGDAVDALADLIGEAEQLAAQAPIPH